MDSIRLNLSLLLSAQTPVDKSKQFECFQCEIERLVSTMRPFVAIFLLLIASELFAAIAPADSTKNKEEEEEEVKQRMYDMLFSPCDKSCLSQQETLAKLRLLEMRLTAELLAAQQQAGSLESKEEEETLEQLKTKLDLVSGIVKLCNTKQERCLKPEMLDEYSQLIGQHLLPRFARTGSFSWKKFKVDTSNAYRCLEHYQRQQRLYCRTRIDQLARKQLDQIERDDRENLIKFFLRRSQDKRVFNEHMKTTSAIVGILQSSGQIPTETVQKVSSADKEKFKVALGSVIVKPCEELHQRMGNLSAEYEIGHKYYGPIGRETELWFDATQLCSTILAEPTSFETQGSLLYQVLRGQSGKPKPKHDISMYLLKNLAKTVALRMIS